MSLSHKCDKHELPQFFLARVSNVTITFFFTFRLTTEKNSKPKKSSETKKKPFCIEENKKDLEQK